MGFQYKDKNKQEEGGWQWTSYSDLFTALSVVFLMMYVVSAMRTGTSGLQKSQAVQKMAKEVEDLREQLRVYNTLKEDYLSKNASEAEADQYAQLMDKLKLLQEENSDEAKKLRAQAQENEQKEQALNKYQQMIRNIINANMVSKGRLKKKDEIISEKQEIITQKDLSLEEQLTDIRQLERTVQDKQKAIQLGQAKIAQVEGNLQEKMQELQKAFATHKLTKQKYNQQIAQLKTKSKEQIEALENQNQQASQELQKMNSQLLDVQSQLVTTQGTLDKEKQRSANLVKDLENSEKSAKAEMDRLNQEFKVKTALATAKLKADLEKQKLSAAEEAKRQAQFQEKLAKEKAELDQKISALNGKMGETQNELKKAQEALAARKTLAKQISDNFKHAGISAEVDGGTGDVYISFDKQYFDTGKADLKPQMVETLKKMIPVYSKSLFQDPKVAKKITSVEIVGFASPTYKGKFVDPESLNPEDRKAVEFNLDLSFQRAKSIFNQIFDTNKMQYANQKDLLPLVKVTGRSFLADGAQGRGLASGISEKDYCSRFECQKSQRVIIKFNMENK